MSRYYIKYKVGEVSTFIELDATVSITETFGGSVTSNPVADRTVVADTFISRNPVFSLSGIITDVVQPFIRVIPSGTASGTPIADVSTKSRTDIIKKTLKNGTLVELTSADEVYSDCVLTSVTLTKTAKEGIGGWKVDLELTQLNLVSALQISLDEAPIDIFSDEWQAKKETTSNTTKNLGPLSGLVNLEGSEGALNSARDLIGIGAD